MLRQCHQDVLVKAHNPVMILSAEHLLGNTFRLFAQHAALAPKI